MKTQIDVLKGDRRFLMSLKPKYSQQETRHMDKDLKF